MLAASRTPPTLRTAGAPSDLAKPKCQNAATVFEEQDTPTWAANSAYFTQRLDGIRKCACAESGQDRVE